MIVYNSHISVVQLTIIVFFHTHIRDITCHNYYTMLMSHCEDQWSNLVKHDVTVSWDGNTKQTIQSSKHVVAVVVMVPQDSSLLVQATLQG